MPTTYDKILKIIWNEIGRMEQAIPYMVSLDKLMNASPPLFSTRSGEKININPEELKELSSIIPKIFWSEFTLPIVFLKKYDHFELLSSKKIIFWLIEKILFPEQELVTPYLIQIAYKPHQTYFYSYHIQKLRKKFPSLVYVLFLGSSPPQENISRLKESFSA
ncbi:MAG: DUF61 family protein [Promethearchaeota archaeon]